MNTITIVGTLESVGKTLTGGIGAEIRGSDGRLIVLPGLTAEELRALAPHICQHVAITIRPATDEQVDMLAKKAAA